MVGVKYAYMDYETKSAIDIKKSGAFRYIEDESFDVLLLAYAFDDRPVRVVDFTQGETWPEEFLQALRDPAVTKVAHNAIFERTVIGKLLGYTPPEEWLDTMHLAAQCGLPLSLDAAGKALGLPEDQAKMREGKALIRYFCQPCKPTKANGGRIWNLPEHAPEKWDTFKAYCQRDVEVERTIFHTLEHWMPSPEERRFWCLDARINERGVRIDRRMAQFAVAMDQRYKEELTAKAVALTGLENPKSVSQVKTWLADQEGKEFPSLNKKVVADVVASLTSDASREFMAIRSELSKSSTAKYEAMLRAACADDHVRGTFQFYGANRTGRMAGRLLQLQNLPQNHMEDLDEARQLVSGGHYTALKALYDGVSQPLSELIRTALIPEPGHQFLVADFSAIEARVIAWMAGERWRLDAFREGADIYCASASQAFHVPVVKHGINGHLRQKGKIMELACIAEDELVLTDTGLVPIQDVTTDMKLWDGEEWVSHDGVVCKGEKEVITYGGLTATPDHLVWVEGERAPVQFGVAAARRARLLYSGVGRHNIRLGEDNQPRAQVQQVMEPLLRSDLLHWLRSCQVAVPREPSEGSIPGVSELFSARSDLPKLVASKSDVAEAALHEPERPGVSELRWPWDHFRFPECASCLPLDCERAWDTHERLTAGLGPDRQREGVCPWKSSLGYPEGQQRESENHPDHRMAARGLAVFPSGRDPETPGRGNTRGNSGRRLDGGSGAAQELASHQGVVRVYDIINAGPRHRFTVSNVLVHNCGYGGGIGAMKAFGADKLGMTEEEMQETVDLWRESSPRICEFWRSMEKAAIRSVVRRAHTVSEIGGIGFDMEQGVLWMTLPSGRRIAYWGARYEESSRNPGRKVLSYMGQNQQTKKWERIETWGGKLVENAVQATARDCLREAMFALDAAGFDIRATVHDEVIVTEPLGGRSVEEMAALMGGPIPWAPGLPLRADGYACPYYQKD